MRWERLKLDMPDDFPVAELDAIHSRLSDGSQERRESPEWAEWAGACNGVAYRYLACDEHGSMLADSLDREIGPPQPERYRQERLLFALFVEGLSCVECFYYGLYFVGAMIDAAAFDPMLNRRKITPGEVVGRYRENFKNEPLTKSLAALNSSDEIDGWRTVRNTLTHRATPPRHFSLGGSNGATWLGDPFSAALIRERRKWLAEAMRGLLVPAAAFVQEQIE